VGLAAIAAPLLTMLLTLTLRPLALTTSALADTTSEYGEVLRFGGFDSSAFNSGHYGGKLTPGEFLDPTGFAVDPQNDTVYVVDRTSSSVANPTDWRIQQFNAKGELLAATMFTLPNGNFGQNSAIAGLAVDHKAQRLYALVIGSPPLSSPDKLTPAAQELLAWSTQPVAGGLVAATAAGGAPLPEDHLSKPLPESPGTVGALISDETQLQSGSTPLYGPQGIVVDHLETAGVDDPIAIEASDLLPEAGRGVPIPGDTIVQQVATQAHGTSVAGELLGRWSGASVKQTLGASWGPIGIADNPDGTMTVILDASNLSATNAYVVKLNPDLSDPVVLNSDATEPPIVDFDQAALWLDESSVDSLAGVGISDMRGAGAELTELSTAASSGADGLYAADIYPNQNIDYQFSPTSPTAEYWLKGDESSGYLSNIGLRLLRPAAQGGAISSPTGETIVNTLGNSAVKGPCHISSPEATLAAGEKGTLWVLDRGPKSHAVSSLGPGVGREVIELAPGAGQLCPQPSGTFTMQATGGVSQSGTEKLVISPGTEVTFDAESIERHGGKPFTYEWDLDGNVTNGPKHDGFEVVNQMIPPTYYWPPATASYTYTHPGRYSIRFRMHTDYGAYEAPAGIIEVSGTSERPDAQFTATSTPGTQQVSFDAASSTAGTGTIANYHWNWGDGSGEDDGPRTALVTHTYAQPGNYNVTLTVTNSAFQSVTSPAQRVLVEAPKQPLIRDANPLLTGPLYAIAFAAYPIPTPGAKGTPTRLVPRTRFAHGALSVTLACPATKSLCAGTVSIETAAAVAAKRSGRSHKKADRLQLGHAAFNIPGGGHTQMSVHLSARGMTLLRRDGHLSVLVIVAAHDAAGDPGTTTLRLTLNASAARGRKAAKRSAVLMRSR
jgi:PKD repeat protein